jgi:2-keto-4-pentenoate hydratase/2-oxohepta-3-ene-1,7-dioic acid hydratase in catechol pathway
MKIIAIARNYKDHAKELDNEVPTEPILFLKPDTAILRPGYDFYHPDFSKNIHHEIELIVKINRVGMNITEKFAPKYYDEIGLGLDFTARDLQTELKNKGLPWSIAKGFNHSAPISTFINKDQFEDLQNLDIELKTNGKTVQIGNTKDMMFGINQIVSYASRFFQLKKGDLIFTGTPAGVAKINIGDKLEGYLNGEKLLDVNIK